MGKRILLLLLKYMNKISNNKLTMAIVAMHQVEYTRNGLLNYRKTRTSAKVKLKFETLTTFKQVKHFYFSV